MESRENILEKLTNLEVIKKYRFDKDGIRYVLQQIEEYIQSKAARNNALTAE